MREQTKKTAAIPVAKNMKIITDLPLKMGPRSVSGSGSQVSLLTVL